MKIEEECGVINPNCTEMPRSCVQLILAVKNAKTTEQFIREIDKGRETHAVMGKTELCRWVVVLNRCDEVLEKAVVKDEVGQMLCDRDMEMRKFTISVLRFTVLLFESTSSRRVYRSMDRVLALLETQDMEMLADVLRLLQTMGKRSKYLNQRLCPSDQSTLVHSLTAIAQCWGGKLRSVKMAECVKENVNLPALFPFTYTDSFSRLISITKPVEGECIAALVERISSATSGTNQTSRASTPSKATTSQNESTILAGSPQQTSMAAEDRYYLLAVVRMLQGFEERQHRVRCLVARLLAVSTLSEFYCRCQPDDTSLGALLYTGFVEELVALLKTEKSSDTREESAMLDTIHAEALSTLCAIVTLEKEQSRINQILEALSAGSYHGFLSVLTRQIVHELKSNELGKPGKPSIALSTALFSFIYHLASIEPGGETLVASGLTQTLLSVIAHHDLPIELITFGTRCARIIDLFTTIDVAAFRNNNGMEICINRVVYEVDQCRKEQPFMIDVSEDRSFEGEPDRNPPNPIAAGDVAAMETSESGTEKKEEKEKEKEERTPGGPYITAPRTGLTCHQQRSGLIKGLLTFVKRAIQDPQFQDSIQHLMDGGLPEALMHILSNAEYYSPSLFHQSAQLITNFVYDKPEQLSALQERHVPFVMLQSLLRKELPNSRDIIGHMGSVFAALCINERGLRQFQSYEPFDQIFRTMLSVKFLVTMKKKRTEMTDTAQTIGTALGDLLRHHPVLKKLMLNSMNKVLDHLLEIGNDPPANTEIVMALAKQTARSMARCAAPTGCINDLPTNESTLFPSTATTSTSTTGAATNATSSATATRASGSSVEPVVDEPPRPVVQEPSPSAAAEVEMAQEDNSNALMEDDEASDVDEDEMSMDEMTSEVSTVNPPSRAEETLPVDSPVEKSLAEKEKRIHAQLGLDMDCDDENGKRILPLGDYMLIAAKILETLLAQQTASEMAEDLIQSSGIEKLLALCQLRCLNTEIAHSSFSQSVANIIKSIALQRNMNSAEQLMKSVMNSFVQTISPVLKQRASPTTSDDAPSASLLVHLKEKTIFDSLNNLNNIMPVLMTITKCTLGGQFAMEMRNRVWDTWLTEDGKKLYMWMRRLSRMLTWETALIRVVKPSIRTTATQTDPGELITIGDHNEAAAATDTSLEHAMDTTNADNEPLYFSPLVSSTPRAKSISDTTSVAAESKSPAWIAAGISPEENAFWIQNKNVADLVIRTGKTLSDLLSLLSRSIFGTSNRRTRRQGDTTQPVLSSNDPAKLLAKMIFTSIYTDLKWRSPTGAGNNPMEYARLTELLAQLSTSLFDDRGKAASVSMIQWFYSSGCHKAFYELLKDRLIPALENSELQGGLEEVLLEWCRLAGKLANRQNMLAATTETDARSAGYRRNMFGINGEFDVNKYLSLVYYDLFNSFTLLFEKLLSSELELANYQSICEVSISVFKEVAPNMVPAKKHVTIEERSAPTAAENSEQQQQRQCLIDMGFTDDEAVEALSVARGSVSEATEILLASRDSAAAASSQEGSSRRTLLDFVRSANPDATLPDEEEETVDAPLIPPLRELRIENDVSVHATCVQLMPLCKRLMQITPDLVYSCSDLIISVLPSLDKSWRRDQLIGKILTQEIIDMTKQVVTTSSEDDIRLLATRIHFACLLFDHIAEEYIEIVHQQPIIGNLLILVGAVEEKFETSYFQMTLLPPIVLWFDLYEKNRRARDRRRYLGQRTGSSLEWFYMGDEERLIGSARPRKWIQYPTQSQKLINNAFFAGKPSVSFKMNGRHNRREKEIEIDFATMRFYDPSSSSMSDHSRNGVRAQLPDSDTDNDLGAVMELGVIHHVAAHSLLSFIARLTRHVENAHNFMKIGGLAALVQLKSSSSTSTKTLTSMIIRNCIEDDAMQAQMFEKCIRSASCTANSNYGEFTWLTTNRPKEWHETLSKLAPVAARNPEVFAEVMDRVVKLDSGNMTLIPAKSSTAPASNDRVVEVVNLLLNETLNGEWSTETANQKRMLSRAAMLSLLSELVKSYPGVALIVCEAKTSSGQTFVYSLLDSYVDSDTERVKL
ncbi:unnamed protein product [Caenorhabditis auriculariae]|uniref:UBA domain-containing protein n=1 Tax=Caenorhabditis auriculariae TaxID=2777116 RepID=A0A8S1HPV3_9PELO|nr:unnamed protein product [Caenorhabditis auriculariae]